MKTIHEGVQQNRLDESQVNLLPVNAGPQAYEVGKEWEWNAAAQAMLSVKDDPEPSRSLTPKDNRSVCNRGGSDGPVY